MKNETLVLHEPLLQNGFQQNPLMQKRTISELSDNEMSDIDGGSILETIAASLAIGYYGYQFGQWVYNQTH